MGSLKGYEQKLIQHLEKAMENVFQSNSMLLLRMERINQITNYKIRRSNPEVKTKEEEEIKVHQKKKDK